METSCDKFLNGRLLIRQPVHGYRAATDPVLLAAAVNAKPGQTVLDVGCGVGVASLCLGARICGLAITGLELQNDYGALATDNATTNKIQMFVKIGDLSELSAELKSQEFDHVITNPPFHKLNNSAPSDAGKRLADQEKIPLEKWVLHCLKRLKPRGYFTIIHLAERLPEILQSLSGCGDIRILPITSREGMPAKRVIVQARKASKSPAKLCAPLVMHLGINHDLDGDSYTDVAKSILRDGKELSWINRL